MTHVVGFVYVLTNPAMPGLVKVGRTKHLAEDRARRLRSTGVPLPFVVVHRTVTSHPKAVERRAHQLLADFRVNNDREFFTAGSEAATEAVHRAAVEMAGIEAWTTDEPVRLVDDDRLALTLRAGQMFAVLPYRRSREVEPPVDLWQAHADGDLLELMATADPGHVSGFGPADPDGEVDPVPHLDRSGEALNGSIIGKERLEPGQRLLWLDGDLKKPGTVLAWFEFDSFCQVVCRTWMPKVTDEGWPLLLNVFMIDPTPTMRAVLKGSLRLPRPQLSNPLRHLLDTTTVDTTTDFGSKTAPADFWLKQLKSEPRRRRLAPDG